MSNAFFAMGGYALYVWSSFGVFAAIMVWNIVAPALRRRAVLQQLVDNEDASQAGAEPR